MANLGSNNTPISGESFDLPSGWSFEENVDGEVVITDSGGATIGRRDEINGEWVFDSIVGDTLEADILNSADIFNAQDGEVPMSQGDGSLSMSAINIPDETGTTSYGGGYTQEFSETRIIDPNETKIFSRSYTSTKTNGLRFRVEQVTDIKIKSVFVEVDGNVLTDQTGLNENPPAAREFTFNDYIERSVTVEFGIENTDPDFDSDPDLYGDYEEPVLAPHNHPIQ